MVSRRAELLQTGSYNVEFSKLGQFDVHSVGEGSLKFQTGHNTVFQSFQKFKMPSPVCTAKTLIRLGGCHVAAHIVTKNEFYFE